MDRLQKKCFIAATGFHLFLVVILFVGPAFLLSDQKRPDLQMIDVIPYKIIEAPFVGVGAPNVKPPPPSEQQKPAPPVPEAKPAPPPPARDEAPPKPEPKPVTRDRDAIEDEKPTKPRLPNISKKLVTRPKTGDTAKNTSTSKNTETDTRQNSKEVAALQSTLRSLKEGLSSATEVGIVGPGGEAYAGYENVIQSIYQHRYDQELITAGDVGTQVVNVEVTVTVARAGEVLSARLLKPSGNAAMNRVVQRVLERVTFIAPFPEGAKDAQRTFNIIFELKPKKVIG